MTENLCGNWSLLVIRHWKWHSKIMMETGHSFDLNLRTEYVIGTMWNMKKMDLIRVNDSISYVRDAFFFFQINSFMERKDVYHVVQMWMSS